MADDIVLNLGSGGPSLRAKEIGGKHYPLGYDFWFATAEGQIPGIDKLSKFGAHFSVDSGDTRELVWSPEVPWLPLTAASTLDIVSDDVNDDVGGTGARTLELIGLDGSWNEQTESVTLDGTTPVTTVNSWLRIFRSMVTTAGALGYNAGTISITATTGGSVQCGIKATYGQSLTACWTVPAGKTFFFTDWYAHIGRSNAAVATVGLFARPGADNADAPEQCKHLMTLSSQGTSNSQISFRPFGIANEKTDVMCKVMECDTNNVIVTAGFDGFYK